MAPLKAHLDQGGHQGIGAKQWLQDGQHQQAAHQVLPEAQGHAEGGLAGGAFPDHPRAGQALTQKQGGEHQADQHAGGLPPHLVDLLRKDREWAKWAHQQAQQASHQSLGNAQLAQPAQPLPQGHADQQQQAEAGEGHQDIEQLHGIGSAAGRLPFRLAGSMAAVQRMLRG